MTTNEKLNLGEFFQQVRKDKGISIDEIARETNISKRYIEAIEANRFDVFPADTYVLGFISTYSDALEIDRETVLSIYRRQMKSDLEAPIAELVGESKKNSYSVVILLFILLILILVTFGVIFFINPYMNKVETEGVATKVVTTKKINEPMSYYFTANDLTNFENKSFMIGDVIIISNDANVVQIDLVEVDNVRNLVLKIMGKDYKLKPGEMLNIDSDNDNINDFNVELIKVSEKNIKISLALLNRPEAIPTKISNEYYLRFKDDIISEKDILNLVTAKRINVKCVFTGTGYMNYDLDNTGEKEIEMKKDLSIDFEFDNEFLLSLGNAGAVTLIIDNKEEKGGPEGEVNKSIFYWKEENKRYILKRAFLK